MGSKSYLTNIEDFVLYFPMCNILYNFNKLLWIDVFLIHQKLNFKKLKKSFEEAIKTFDFKTDVNSSWEYQYLMDK